MLQSGLELLLIILLLFEVVAKIKGYHKRVIKQRQAQIQNLDNIKKHENNLKIFYAEQSEANDNNENNDKTGSNEELRSTDLLDEANIYIEYKMYDQAITVLKWYIDVHNSDFAAIDKLLNIHLLMGNIDDYVNTLNSIPIKTKDQIQAEEWRIEAIKNGLRHEPDNPELLILIEKYKIVYNNNDSNNKLMNTEKALKLVTQSNNYNYQVYILKKAIKNEPRKLALYAEILSLAYKNKKYEDYLDGLILLFIALGEINTNLQKRILSVSKKMNLGPDFTELAGWNGDTDKLKRLAIKRKIHLPEPL